MRPVPKRWAFLVGAHIDQVYRLQNAPQLHVSNPAHLASTPGGSALNVASIAARLGIGSLILSPVGDDLQGRELHAVARARDLGDGLIYTAGAKTGSYTALIAPDGDVFTGAADLSIYDMIDHRWIDNHLGPVLQKGSGVFVTANLGTDALMRSIEIMRSADAFCAAATISPAKALRLKPHLAGIDLLMTNRAEAIALTGASGDIATEALAKALIAHGVNACTITDGRQPVAFTDNGKVGELEVAPCKMNGDANGAGDAFQAGLISALSNGLSMERATAFAIETAALCLQTDGPYPDTKALDALGARLESISR